MNNSYPIIKTITSLLFFLIVISATAQKIELKDSAEVFLPGLVSTKNAEVRITFSPDGNKMLWGGIDWIANKKDLDIWMSDKVKGRWTIPVRASFDTDSNDFDPFFSPDGKGVYFFSNRGGGYGMDDIYFARYNSSANTFSEAKNLGDKINTKGNEWAPGTDRSGKTFFFSSDGHGGFGGQDLFRANILKDGFAAPLNLGPSINGTKDDFDAAVLPNGSLIFTSTRTDGETAQLYFAARTDTSYAAAVLLPEQVNNPAAWTFGPSVNFKEPGYLYFSGHRKENVGRTDVYRVKFVK